MSAINSPVASGPIGRLVHGARSYRPTPWGMVRIAGLVLFMLWLVGLVFPAGNGMLSKASMVREIAADPRLRAVVAPRNDGRGVLERHLSGSTSQTGPSPAVVAWIGGSSNVLHRSKADKAKRAAGKKLGRRQLLPSKVLDDLNLSCANQPVVADVYISQAMRTLDQHALLQHALRTRPDAVVVTLNPLWAFNDRGINQRQDILQGALYHGVADPSLMYWAGLIGQPANFAYASSAQFLPIVRDRWDYHRQISAFVKKYQPDIQGTRKEKRARKRKLKKQLRVLNTAHRFPQCAPDCIVTQDDGAGYRLIRRMFETIHASGVQAIIYEAPVNLDRLVAKAPERPAARTREAFAGVLKAQSAAVRKIADDINSPNISVLTADDWSPAGLKFADMIHVTDVGTAPKELAARLSPLVCDTGVNTKGAGQ